jgi:hypothetical protein
MKRLQTFQSMSHTVIFNPHPLKKRETVFTELEKEGNQQDIVTLHPL